MDRLGLTQRQLADRLQISQGAIAQALAMLALPAGIQARVDVGELAPTVAYELAKLPTPETQAALADRIRAEGLTRSDVVKEVRATRTALAGRGRRGAGGKNPRVTRRVIRRPAGTVTVELRRGKRDGQVADLVALLAEAQTRLQAEPDRLLHTDGQARQGGEG